MDIHDIQRFTIFC